MHHGMHQVKTYEKGLCQTLSSSFNANQCLSLFQFNAQSSIIELKESLKIQTSNGPILKNTPPPPHALSYNLQSWLHRRPLKLQLNELSVFLHQLKNMINIHFQCEVKVITCFGCTDDSNSMIAIASQTTYLDYLQLHDIALTHIHDMFHWSAINKAR